MYTTLKVFLRVLLSLYLKHGEVPSLLFKNLQESHGRLCKWVGVERLEEGREDGGVGGGCVSKHPSLCREVFGRQDHGVLSLLTQPYS